MQIDYDIICNIIVQFTIYIICKITTSHEHQVQKMQQVQSLQV